MTTPNPTTHFFIESQGDDLVLQQGSLDGFTEVRRVPQNRKGVHQLFNYIEDFFGFVS